MNILVLCTGNSARSILLEAILNHHGGGKLRAFSAGSQPVGVVNPYAIQLLETLAYDVDDVYSKSWDVFESDESPDFDVIITVCDNAAGETCPIYLSKAEKIHFGIPDPAKASETDAPEAFRQAYLALMDFASKFLSERFT